MKTFPSHFGSFKHLIKLWVWCWVIISACSVVQAAIIKGPYLQNVTKSSIVVMWETDGPTDGQVDYGTSSALGSTATGSGGGTIHQVSLSSLTANTTYYYTVTSGSATSSQGHFMTAPDATVAYRFAVYGDTRSYPADHEAVIKSMIPHDPDFVLHVGDFVNAGKTYSEWGPQYFTPASALLLNVPLFPVLGNHEYSGTEKMWYYDFFAVPDNGLSQYPEHWYAFTYGGARFIGLNACEGGDSFLPGSAQHSWLTTEFKSAAFQNARWRFVWMHNPPYTAVEQDNAVDSNLRTYLVPLFEQYGVDVVFSGDDHFYRHSLRNGIHYIITGGGGAPLHEVGTPMAGATLIAAKKILEHCIVDLSPSRFDFYASDIYGNVIDSFSLTGLPAPTGLTASAGESLITLSWNSAVNATGYDLKRSTISGGPYTTIADNITATSFADIKVANGTTYYYVVAAHYGTVSSDDSAQVSATPACVQPAVPTALNAAAGDGQVTLTWNASAAATGYNVKRALKRGGPYDTIASVSGNTSYIDSGLANGTTYFYVVSAVNNCGESVNSTRVSATPQGAPAILAPPANLTATPSKKGPITLRWTASTGATSYKIERATSSNGSYSTIPENITGTTYSDASVVSGTTYYYKVIAVNASGVSQPSNVASAVAK